MSEHKSNSLFDILITNKKKKNHSLQNWRKLTCVTQTLQRTLSSAQLQHQTSCKPWQLWPLLVIPSPCKIALTRMVKIMSRRNEKSPPQNCTKNTSLEATDLFAGGWIKIASGSFQWFTWIHQRHIWLTGASATAWLWSFRARAEPGDQYSWPAAPSKGTILEVWFNIWFKQKCLWLNWK